MRFLSFFLSFSIFLSPSLPRISIPVAAVAWPQASSLTSQQTHTPRSYNFTTIKKDPKKFAHEDVEKENERAQPRARVSCLQSLSFSARCSLSLSISFLSRILFCICAHDVREFPAWRQSLPAPGRPRQPQPALLGWEPTSLPFHAASLHPPRQREAYATAHGMMVPHAAVASVQRPAPSSAAGITTPTKNYKKKDEILHKAKKAMTKG